MEKCKGPSPAQPRKFASAPRGSAGTSYPSLRKRAMTPVWGTVALYLERENVSERDRV